MIPDTSSPVPLRGVARVAGLCYIVVIALGLAQAAFVSSRFSALDAPADLAALVAQSLAFRLGVVSDVVLYALVLTLSVALYFVLRGVNSPLALGGLVLRSAEAVVGLSATVVGGVGPLLLLSDPGGTDPGHVVLLLAVRESALDVILVLVGLGGAAFCYLFLQSRLAPSALALWGLLTYVSMVILGATGILWPTLPSAIRSALFAQGASFELVFGLWLTFKATDVATRASALGGARS